MTSQDTTNSLKINHKASDKKRRHHTCLRGHSAHVGRTNLLSPKRKWSIFVSVGGKSRFFYFYRLWRPFGPLLRPKRSPQSRRSVVFLQHSQYGAKYGKPLFKEGINLLNFPWAAHIVSYSSRHFTGTSKTQYGKLIPSSSWISILNHLKLGVLSHQPSALASW